MLQNGKFEHHLPLQTHLPQPSAIHRHPTPLHTHTWAKISCFQMPWGNCQVFFNDMQIGGSSNALRQLLGEPSITFKLMVVKLKFSKFTLTSATASFIILPISLLRRLKETDKKSRLLFGCSSTCSQATIITSFHAQVHSSSFHHSFTFMTLFNIHYFKCCPVLSRKSQHLSRMPWTVSLQSTRYSSNMTILILSVIIVTVQVRSFAFNKIRRNKQRISSDWLKLMFHKLGVWTLLQIVQAHLCGQLANCHSP